MSSAAARPKASSRFASLLADCARTSRAAFSTSRVRPDLRALEGPLRRLVEHVVLLRADGLSVEDRERLNSARNRPDSEAERARPRLEARHDLLVLRFELLGELRLRLLDLLGLGDRRHLGPQLLDERVHGHDERRAEACRKHEGSRRLGAVEVVDVDDVWGRRSPLGEAGRVADDVVLDHHLRRGRDEDVEARLPRDEPQLQRPPRDGGDQLEEAVALARDLREDVRVGVGGDGEGGDAEGVAAASDGARGVGVAIGPGDGARTGAFAAATLERRRLRELSTRRPLRARTRLLLVGEGGRRLRSMGSRSGDAPSVSSYQSLGGGRCVAVVAPRVMSGRWRSGQIGCASD